MMEGQNTINDADDDDVPLLLVPQINASVPAGIAHQDLSDDDDEDGSHEQHHLHYIPLHSKPTPRQEWVQHTCQHTGKKLQISSLASSKEHRIATDSDLVLDLVYVIILAHLGRIFRGRAIEHNDPTWAFRDFFTLFGAVWYQWHATMTHLNVFERSDILHLVFFLLSLVSMAYIGRSIGPCGAHVAEDCKTFVRAMSLGRGLTVAMQFLAFYSSPKVRRGILVTLVPNTVVAILYAIVGEQDDPLPARHLDYVWFAVVLVDTVRFVNAHVGFTWCGLIKHKQQETLQNLALHVERQHLFVILSLGELITAGLAGGDEGHGAAAGGHSANCSGANSSNSSGHGGHGGNGTPGYDEHFWLVGLVVLLAGLVKIAIFDVEDHPEAHGLEQCSATGQTHALARQTSWGKLCGVLWVFFYPFLNVCIVLAASMLEPLTVAAELPPLSQTVICLTIASILFITGSMDLLHYGGPKSSSRRISKPLRVIARYMFAAGVACMSMVEWGDRKSMFLITINLLVAGAVAFMLFARYPAIPGQFRCCPGKQK